MKTFRSLRRLGSIAVIALSAALAQAQSDFIDLRNVGPVHGNAEAVRDRIAACLGCHGKQGVPTVPTFPAIAGQSPEFLYAELREFKREARPDSPMTAIVRPLSDEDMRNYAVYFATLPPPPARGAGSERGRRLYLDGDPAKGLPPCQGCHGAAGGGHPLAATQPRYRIYPALRGQHAEYLVQRIEDLRAGKHMATSGDRLMHGIAQAIDRADAGDIAAWLQAAPR